MKEFSSADIESMDKRFRTQFVNSLSGFKSLFMLGTQSARGNDNLAIFSSVVHVGAHPALLGCISRPNSVPRHTLENILETGYYSLNAVGKSEFEKAHQTSARYDLGISEFKMSGLTRELKEGNTTPFVKESSLQILLKYEEHYDIKANGTHFIIGRIEKVWLANKNVIHEDGHIDLQSLDLMAGSGIDAYHEVASPKRLPYAKP